MSRVTMTQERKELLEIITGVDRSLGILKASIGTDYPSSFTIDSGREVIKHAINRLQDAGALITVMSTQEEFMERLEESS